MKTVKIVRDVFEVREEISCSDPQQSRCVSVQSQQIITAEISKTIDTLITEQKKRYMPSKTENKMNSSNNEIIPKAKRFYSVSNVSNMKPILQLPQHIKRILNSTKRYPNLPNLEKNQDQLDKIYGAFFGFLIGDVVGSHMAYTAVNCQFLVPSALMMNGGGTYNLGPGQGTDQTQILFTLSYALIETQGIYNRNLIGQKYLQWFQSKPFNFSAVFALAMKDIRRMKINKQEVSRQKIGDIIYESSKINRNQESSIGLIRVLPLVIFSLKFSEPDFQRLIKDEMQMICPNELVMESSFVYAKILRVIILTRDQERAFYEASKWVYEEGSIKLKQLWKLIEKGVEIPSRGNMGRLKTSFSYSCIELYNKDVNFVDCLIRVLRRGGDTQTNCAIVMALVGAIVGYNGIPSYLRQKIVNSRMKDSPRPRNQIYSPHKVIELIQKLQAVQNEIYIKNA